MNITQRGQVDGYFMGISKPSTEIITPNKFRSFTVSKKRLLTDINNTHVNVCKMGDFLLTPKRKNAIRTNGPKLLDAIILSPKLFILLRANNTLTAHKQEEITLPILTNDDKVGRLLDFIPKTGNRGFETFIEALVETDQFDAACLLDEQFARPLIDAKLAAREGDKENVNQPAQVVDRGDVSFLSIAEETLDGSTPIQQTPGIPPAASELVSLHSTSFQQTPNIPPNPTTAGHALGGGGGGGCFPGNGMMPPHPMYAMYNPALFGMCGPAYQFGGLPYWPVNPVPPSNGQPVPAANAYLYPNPNTNHQIQPSQPLLGSSETPVKQVVSSGQSNNTPAGTDGSSISDVNPQLESSAAVNLSQLSIRPRHNNTLVNAEKPAVTTTEQLDENNETEIKQQLSYVAKNPPAAYKSHSNDQLGDKSANSKGTVSATAQSAGSESSAANHESSSSVAMEHISLHSPEEDCLDQPGTRRKPPVVSDLDPRIVNHFPYAAKLLQGRTENEVKELKQFYMAISASPEMKINLQNVKEEDAVKLITDPEEKLYPLRSRPHKGLAILISIKTFFDHATRHGTESDVINLTALFKALNFRVETRGENLTSEGIMSMLKTEAKSKELSKYDAFVLVVMSHGIAGKFFGSDSEEVDIDETIRLFGSDNCPQLAGKPKLFFIQACQGDQKSKMSTDSDSAEDEMDADASHLNDKLSVQETYQPSLKNVAAYEHDMAHMLIVYATVRGYRAYRYKQLGSCFVRSLVYTFSNFAHKTDVMSMVLYKLNDFMNVIKAYEDNSEEELIHLLSPVQSTLRRKLYLFPGYDGRKFDEL